jgi:hypothetical protein
MFWCLPSEVKCEWVILQPFVSHLNIYYDTCYIYEKCLDVLERNKPAPEVLILDQNSGRRAVIERKIIVWPRDKIKYHEGEHFFIDRFIKKAAPLFDLRANTYKLVINGPFYVSKYNIQCYADQIAKCIQTKLYELSLTGANENLG